MTLLRDWYKVVGQCMLPYMDFVAARNTHVFQRDFTSKVTINQIILNFLLMHVVIGKFTFWAFDI